METTKKIWIADSPEDYRRLNLQKNVAAWEDGMRTDGKPGVFEWWYMDATLEGGGNLVTTFFTKHLMASKGPLAPMITLNYNSPDGTRISNANTFAPSDFSASVETTDVQIGKNTFRGDLKHYEIHYEHENVSIDVMWDNIVPSWRPETGHEYFGDLEHYYAWFVGTPKGRLAGRITIDGRETIISGTAYHDHNWGNMQLEEMWHHWYWGRGDIGEYTVIGAMNYGTKEFGYHNAPIFMLAKGDEILADRYQCVTLREEGMEIDPKTGKPYHQKLIFDYKDGETQYTLTYSLKKVILRVDFNDTLTEEQREAAKKAGLSPKYYLRFAGTGTIESHENGQTTCLAEGPAIWEEPYFGENLLNNEYRN